MLKFDELCVLRYRLQEAADGAFIAAFSEGSQRDFNWAKCTKYFGIAANQLGFDLVPRPAEKLEAAPTRADTLQDEADATAESLP